MKENKKASCLWLSIPVKYVKLLKNTWFLKPMTKFRPTKAVAKKEGAKKIPDCFWCLFLQQLAAEKKTPKMVRLDFFGPSYFETALLFLLFNQTLFRMIFLTGSNNQSQNYKYWKFGFVVSELVDGSCDQNKLNFIKFVSNVAQCWLLCSKLF